MRDSLHDTLFLLSLKNTEKNQTSNILDLTDVEVDRLTTVYN